MNRSNWICLFTPGKRIKDFGETSTTPGITCYRLASSESYFLGVLIVDAKHLDLDIAPFAISRSCSQRNNSNLYAAALRAKDGSGRVHLDSANAA